MPHSDKVRNEDVDIWDAFDEAVEHAEKHLKQAWENYEVVQQTDDSLSEEYISALTNIEETIEEFDSVYEVTDAELERADRACSNARFLASVTQAYREYHEATIERRANVAKGWFDALTACTKRVDSDIATDQSSLQRQMQALEKLTNVGKYGQLLDSDRIELAEIENRVREFHQAVQDEVPTEAYIRTGLELAGSFQNQYTDDLAELVGEGVDREAISITEHVSGILDLEPVASRLEEDATTDDDAEAVGNAVDTYADVAVLTGKQRAKYELGNSLIETIEDSPVSDGTDVEKDLRLRLNSFQLEPIENLVRRLIEGEATTSDTEQLMRVLTKHGGSVRRTAESLDRSTEELFEDLHDLLLQNEIADLEVRFE